MQLHPHQSGLSKRLRHRGEAFTLTEMLVVLVIIGLMAAMILPSLPGLLKGNVMTAANRQFVDDLAYARQRAISDHTKVYMVFVPNEFWNRPGPNVFKPQSQTELNELITGQYTSYALFSFRTVGDQPGQTFPKYLTDWRSLPDGVAISTNKFGTNRLISGLLFDPNFGTNIILHPFSHQNFPFPQTELALTNAPIQPPAERFLPYLAWDSRGQLISDKAEEYVPLVRASIFHPKGVNETNLQQAPDIVVTETNFNVIRIDRLTGRAKLMQQELK